ncbi:MULTISPECIES: hypothetical protein [Clostridium]|uniref:Uncharacterized protein n=2 Tax=Clostridium cadaveris TaxID=1529 RepID=A0A1I2MYE3_9CLOT|nr:hypothetical protein [Clostridium cadaveris]MDU4953252.1 hypothetical protein [Clostridium sp.]MDM8313460.1 hypothetical protein [Clostridium cadaveris]MDY4948724.1 hypothetical protein [Clostridium cadaveris]NME65395.1 hypothetical protein [Clostridium cadaveris]NWK11796.1 hypothetical protein [Clostridium cadaveris]
MSNCPFLSTNRESVQCFKTCAFYDKGEECPFKLYLDRDDFKGSFSHILNDESLFIESDDEDMLAL